jgi:hypothetical protein
MPHLTAILPFLLAAAVPACPKAKQKGDGLVWTYQQKSKSVCVPQLTAAKDKAAMQAVNALLAKLAKPECEGTYEVRPVSAFAKRGFFGISSHVYLNCGGAHPEAYTDSRTYDLTTGEQLTYAAVFRDASDRGALLRTALYANPHALPPGDCQKVDIAEGNPEVSFALTPDGVDVWPELVHATAACGVPLHLSWRQVEPFLAEKSPLRRFIPAR